MKFSGPWKNLALLIPLTLILVGCGKSKFQKQEFQATAVAGQYITTKPKIDVLLFQDNSDSVMFGPIGTLKPQMQSFLNSMSDQCDLHFTVLPLLSVKSLNTKYVVASDCSTISGVLGCLNTSQASTFNNSSGDYGWINSVNSAVGSSDRGFYNIYANLLQSSITSTGFLRSDAALAVVVVSNGEDVDGMGYTDPDGDGHYELDYSTGTSTFNSYRNFFQNFKGASVLSKFYSVVSPGGTCYGFNSINGRRYRDMADALGSRSYNLCTSELNSVMTSLKSQLTAVAEAVQFNYVVMDQKPMVSSIVVKKNGVVIPQSNSNGWTYVGYLSNQPTSFAPVSGNLRTGYFIQLNGSAIYKGTDQISITFQKE